MWELIVIVCSLTAPCISHTYYVESLETCQAVGTSYVAPDLIYCRFGWLTPEDDQIVYEYEDGIWVLRGGIAL